MVGDRAITEFNYRLSDPRDAAIFVGIETKSTEDQVGFENMLKKHDYQFEDLGQDELAKEHIRYMIGGQAKMVENEVIIRVEFPERPGALLGFLKAIGSELNITLFHYRAIGGDIGRVLIGFDTTRSDRNILLSLLDTTGYPYEDVSSDTAYRLFLR